VRRALHEPHAYPSPAGIVEFVEKGVDSLVASLSRSERGRLSGIGIAAPFELWNWEEQIGAPRAVLDQWRTFDAQSELARILPWPVFFCNDATAACGAELILGNPGHHSDFLYFFIGSFIGGGLALNGSLYPGRTGNAGALGSMPIGGGPRPGQQLIRSASIYVLEHRLVAAGRDASVLWRSPDDWGDLGAALDEWIDEAAQSLALAILAATSVLDFAAVIIDGAFPEAVRAAIVERTRTRVEGLDRQGLSPVEIVGGTIGSGARAIGGACLPLLANYTRDRELLFKESA
jgi:predicted NBD/HSP70 family sugar kinase